MPTSSHIYTIKSSRSYGVCVNQSTNCRRDQMVSARAISTRKNAKETATHHQPSTNAQDASTGGRTYAIPKLSARLWHPNGLSSDTIHLPENCRSQHSMLHPAASAPAHGPPTAPNDIIRAPHNSPAISAATNTLVTTQNRQAALRSGLTTVSLVCVGCSAFAFMGFKPNFFSAPRSPDNPPERSRR